MSDDPKRSDRPTSVEADALPPDDAEVHHALNIPIGEPDPTEWPDPYDRRPDPLGPEGRPTSGSQSTSQPHPSQDPEAEPWEGPKRDRVDD